MNQDLERKENLTLKNEIEILNKKYQYQYKRFAHIME